MKFYHSAFLTMLLVRWGGNALLGFLRDGYEGRRCQVRLANDPLGDSLPATIIGGQFISDDIAREHIKYRSIHRIKIAIPDENTGTKITPMDLGHWVDPTNPSQSLHQLRGQYIGRLFSVAGNPHQPVENFVSMEGAEIYRGLDNPPSGIGIVLPDDEYPVPLAECLPLGFFVARQPAPAELSVWF